MTTKLDHEAVRATTQGHPLVGQVNDGTEGIYVGRMKVGGRDSPFGNPYVVGRDGSRDEVIELFRTHLWSLINADADTWVPMLAALHGERLLCHCAPQRCHAEVLVDASSWAWAEMGRSQPAE